MCHHRCRHRVVSAVSFFAAVLICFDNTSALIPTPPTCITSSRRRVGGGQGTLCATGLDDADAAALRRAAFQSSPGTIAGPSPETKPNYDDIHGPLGKFIDDQIFLRVFRHRMAEQVGVDSDLPHDDYRGLMELTSALNARYSDRAQVQRIAQDVLRSLFPSWLPPQFAVLFSKPFPAFSSRLNAWATWWAGTWLMGECEVNDCDTDEGEGLGINQGLLVKRCRFLEESGCASVCVNSCKIPTQKFFVEDMGLPLTMTPDYETGECQFSFGLTPTAETEFEARNVPCLSRCPSVGGMRTWHDGNYSKGTSATDADGGRCQLMGDDED